MATYPTKNDRKAKRLTYKQRVLNIYPNAEYYMGNIVYKAEVKYSWKAYPILETFVLAQDFRNSTRAWRAAWRYTQELMVEKLEQ